MRLRNVKNKSEIMESSNYLITNPCDYKGKWKSLFKNDNPIYIEIGMGKGKFLMEMARIHPEIHYIGIEMFSSVLVRTVQKIEDHRVYLTSPAARRPEDRGMAKGCTSAAKMLWMMTMIQM